MQYPFMKSDITVTPWNGIDPRRDAVNPFNTTDADDDEVTQAVCKSCELQPVEMDGLLG